MAATPETRPSEKSPKRDFAALRAQAFAGAQPASKPAGWTEQGARTARDFASLLDLTIRLIVVAAVVGFIALATLELTNRSLIIEPIGVPAPLVEHGYSPEVAAHHLMDALQELKSADSVGRDSLAALPASRSTDIVVPGVGLSLKSVVSTLRAFLNLPETRVAGEFVCTETPCTRQVAALRLRVIDDGISSIVLDSLGDGDAGSYFEQAAEQVLLRTDPYVVARHVYRDRPEEAHRIALRVLRERPADAKWAWNIIGLVQSREGSHKAAMESFRKALDADAKFSTAMVNWGNALRQSGRPTEAIEKYQAALEIDGKDSYAHANWAYLSLEKGDVEGAVDHYREAIAIDPGHPSLHVNLAIALNRSRAYAEAIEELRIALSFDEALPEALEEWGASLVLQAQTARDPELARSRYAAAVEKLQDAKRAYSAQAEPTSARLNPLLGIAKSVLARYAEAGEDGPDAAEATATTSLDSIIPLDPATLDKLNAIVPTAGPE